MNQTEENFQLTWLPKKTFEIMATFSWEEVQSSQEKAIEESKKTLEIDGFRKGKAPSPLVIKALGPQKLLELTLQHLVPEAYQKAVSQLGLKPITTPKVQLISAKEKEAWQIKFTGCEEPEFQLGDYKEEIRRAKAVKEIWTPEKGTVPPDATSALSWLLQNIKIEINDLLLEEEVIRKLVGLLEQTQKLGLTIEQYLSSIGKTVEQIKEDYRKASQDNLALEFILGRIAEEEKIEVKPEEIDQVIAQVKDAKEKSTLESQRYYLAGLLRRQKTLDFLASL